MTLKTSINYKIMLVHISSNRYPKKWTPLKSSSQKSIASSKSSLDISIIAFPNWEMVIPQRKTSQIDEGTITGTFSNFYSFQSYYVL